MSDMKEEEGQASHYEEPMVSEMLCLEKSEERFLASLGPETRNVLMETVRMRNEFLSDVSRMLTSGPEAMTYADSVRSSAVEVAYRWRLYRTMLQRYAELEMPSFVRIEVPSE